MRNVYVTLAAARFVAPRTSLLAAALAVTALAGCSAAGGEPLATGSAEQQGISNAAAFTPGDFVVHHVRAGYQGHLEIAATGNPAPTIRVLTVPDGMTLVSNVTNIAGPAAGPPALVSWDWTPTRAQIGAAAVVLEARNARGAVQQSFDIVVDDAPTTPTHVVVRNPGGDTSVLDAAGNLGNAMTVSWDASTNGTGPLHYRVCTKLAPRNFNVHLVGQACNDVTGTTTTIPFNEETTLEALSNGVAFPFDVAGAGVSDVVTVTYGSYLTQ